MYPHLLMYCILSNRISPPPHATNRKGKSEISGTRAASAAVKPAYPDVMLSTKAVRLALSDRCEILLSCEALAPSGTPRFG